MVAGLSLSMLFPDAASGQGVLLRRGIEGRVIAKNMHSAIRAATVTLEDLSGRALQTTTTDDNGRFAFYDIDLGRYTVRVEAVGFERATTQAELLQEEPRIDLEISLRARPDPASTPPPATVPAWALQIPDEASRNYAKALELVRQQKYRASITPLETAVSVYPKFAAAFTTLGAVHQHLKETPQAVAAYRQALQIDESQTAACLGLGSILRAQKQTAEAESLLLRADSLHADDWRVKLELAELYVAADAIEKAEPHLRRARELHGESPRVFLLLINVLAMQEKFPEALAAMDDYLQHFPKDSFAEQVRKKRASLQEFLRTKGNPR